MAFSIDDVISALGEGGDFSVTLDITFASEINDAKKVETSKIIDLHNGDGPTCRFLVSGRGTDSYLRPVIVAIVAFCLKKGL